MCIICASELSAEMNKKMNWRPDRLIKWAGRRGLVVNEKQLQEHFSNHLEPSIKTTPLLKEKTKSRIRNVQTKQTNNNKS